MGDFCLVPSSPCLTESQKDSHNRNLAFLELSTRKGEEMDCLAMCLSQSDHAAARFLFVALVLADSMEAAMRDEREGFVVPRCCFLRSESSLEDMLELPV